MPFVAATDNCVYPIGETIKAAFVTERADAFKPTDIELRKRGDHNDDSPARFSPTMLKQIDKQAFCLSFCVQEPGQYLLGIRGQDEFLEGSDFCVLAANKYDEYWGRVCQEDFPDADILATPNAVLDALHDSAEELLSQALIRELRLVQFKLHLNFSQRGSWLKEKIYKYPLEWMFQRWLEVFLGAVFLGGSIELLPVFGDGRLVIRGSVKSSIKDQEMKILPPFMKYALHSKGIDILRQYEIIKEQPGMFDIVLR